MRTEEQGIQVQLPKAPPVHAFPEHPASWYLFAHLDALRKGPLTKMILGRRPFKRDCFIQPA